MLKFEPLALELLEYKVSDILSKRVPKGGQASTWQLYEYLLKRQALLTPAENLRFQKVSQALKRVTGTSIKKVAASFEDLEIGGSASPTQTAAAALTGIGAAPVAAAAPQRADLSPAEREEAAILKTLAHKVWWDGLSRIFGHLAATYRAERDRQTLRLLWATLRNMGHYVKDPSFATDPNLVNFKVKEAITDFNDPLLSLNDLESITELMREVASTILTLKEPRSSFASLQIPEEGAFSYVRRVALAVARDPYAGRLSLLQNKGPTADQLRFAIQELGREGMREDLMQEKRQALEERLQMTLNNERNQRRLFEQDTKMYTASMTSFFDGLATYMPDRVGGRASQPQLPGGVLFAVNNALSMDAVPADATAITVKLRGPVRFSLSGIDMAISGSGGAWALYIGDSERPLQSRLAFTVGQRQMLVYSENGYVHLSIQEAAKSLASLVAEALALHYIMQHADSLQGIIKMATGYPVTESQELIRQAIKRFSTLTNRAPDRQKALEGFVRGSARALGIEPPEEVLTRLVSILFAAMSSQAGDLERLLVSVPKMQYARGQLLQDPISLQVGGQPLTIRKYSQTSAEGVAQETVIVMAPGRPLGSFSDYMLQNIGNGSLICALADSELVVLYLPHETRQESYGTYPSGK